VREPQEGRLGGGEGDANGCDGFKFATEANAKPGQRQRTKSSVLIFCQIVFKLPHLLLIPGKRVVSAKQLQPKCAETLQRRKTGPTLSLLLLRRKLFGRELLVNMGRKRLGKLGIPKRDRRIGEQKRMVENVRQLSDARFLKES
jgi:hypothetical protein